MAISEEAFDFVQYLRNLDQEVIYTVHPVTGGVVNVTVRATKHGEDIQKGRFVGYASMILKYAPPYIAKIGKDAPFSQSRQVVEARALKLLGESSSTGLHAIATESNIAIPALLFHDPKQHVLVIEDLGTHRDLTEIFSDLGGHHPTLKPVQPNYSHFGGAKLSPESAAYFRDVGTRVGAFFARLHEGATKECIPNRSEFDNQEGKDVILAHSVEPAIQRLAEFLGPGQQAKAISLGDAVKADAVRKRAEEELSFVLGDCWPSAILASDPNPQTTSSLVAVIDWEFAHIGPGAHGDMAQLMAHIEMLRLSAKQHPKLSSHLQAVNELTEALTDSYRSCSKGTANHDPLRDQKIRTAFICCGVEMINCAQWKKWTCADPECAQDHESETSSPKCAVVTRITEEGVKLLEIACEDLGAFQSTENQTRIEIQSTLCHENGEKWLIDLF